MWAAGRLRLRQQLLRDRGHRRGARVRAPTFLLATGYGQIRSVVAALAGDHAGAARRDPGPPAAAMCGANRALLAAGTGWRQPAAAGPQPPGGTVADWSTASCC